MMNSLSQVNSVATADVEGEENYLISLQQKSEQVERGAQQCRLHAIDLFIYRIITL